MVDTESDLQNRLEYEAFERQRLAALEKDFIGDAGEIAVRAFTFGIEGAGRPTINPNELSLEENIEQEPTVEELEHLRNGAVGQITLSHLQNEGRDDYRPALRYAEEQLAA